ncbi:pentapeptide repeat-containing protein, partial [Mycobacterium tuberculosis]|uniref:pentapeptide repeat-containing protein n=1 Tax=Mycobacterium tuberculosis TaxID=1773 RepID=UPI001243F138
MCRRWQYPNPRLPKRCAPGSTTPTCSRRSCRNPITIVNIGLANVGNGNVGLGNIGNLNLGAANIGDVN